jgi:hypothetical protein
MNIAKKKPLYSVWKPATSSLSASGMSKGVRLHSAIPATKKVTKAMGMRGKYRNSSQFWSPPACTATRSCMLRLPAIITGTRSSITAGISYDTIWAAERMPPKSAYLLFEAQPAMISPITDRLEIAATKKTPTLRSAPWSRPPQGITTRGRNAPTQTMIGARRNSFRSNSLGKIASLKRSFTESAIVWRNPPGNGVR